MSTCTGTVNCPKPSKHGVRCPHCDFSVGGCASHVHAASTRVQEHMGRKHPQSTTPPQHG